MKTIVLGIVLSLWALAQSSMPSHSQAVAHGIKHFTIDEVNNRLIECIETISGQNDEAYVVVVEKLNILKDVFSSPVFKARIIEEKGGEVWFKNKKALISETIEGLKRNREKRRG